AVFRDTEVLGERRIHVEESRSAESDASGCAGRTGVREGEPRLLFRGKEEDTVAALIERAQFSVAGDIRVRESRAWAGRPAGRDSEHVPALPDVQDADVPSAQQGIHPARRRAHEAPAMPYRQRIQDRRVERVRLVKI